MKNKEREENLIRNDPDKSEFTIEINFCFANKIGSLKAGLGPAKKKPALKKP